MFTDNLFLRSFLGVILTLIFNSIANGSNILFHEEVGNQAIIYSIAPDGTNLKKIGQGLFPQWSPDRKFISYIESLQERKTDPTIVRGLVVTEPGGKEVFRIGGTKDITTIVRYRWAPDSNGIALVTVLGRHQGTIAYYDIKTKQLKPLHKVEFKDLDFAFITTTLEWLPDGKQILFSSEGKGVFLIDIKDGATKNLSDAGILPRFVSNKVLFMIGSEVWTINLDGSDKKKTADIGMPLITSSNAANNKIIFQVDAQKIDREYPFRLYLLDLSREKLNPKEIKSNYILLCPNISPDGSKFTAIGMRLKDEKGQFVSEEEANLGYYIFDLETQQVKLLKRFEDGKRGKGFWWGVYLGYGNHTIWY
jgi:Tol biopolymer transport system component